MTFLGLLHRTARGAERRFLTLEEHPWRVSVNGSSTIFVGEIFGTAVRELEELGFIIERAVGIYDLSPDGLQVAKQGPAPTSVLAS